MTGQLRLADEESLHDLGRYAARARSVDADGGMRLHATGRVLAAYVAVLPGSGLLGQGLVLGLRVLALAEDADLDVTVPLAAVTDRVARGGADLLIPPVRLTLPWGAVAPPRGGWEPVGTVGSDEVADAAREGIEAVATGTTEGAGGAAVAALRSRVWAGPTRTVPPFPAGGAFAAYSLGFLEPGGEVGVYATGRWTRLSTAAGHVLLR